MIMYPDSCRPLRGRLMLVAGLGCRSSFALPAWQRLDGLRFSVPLGIAEVVVCLDEVVDREVVLALVEARAAADNLLELDQRVDRAHQDDVTDVARIDASGELLRRRQDRGDRLFVIAKVTQVLLAELTIVGGHPLTVVRV